MRRLSPGLLVCCRYLKWPSPCTGLPEENIMYPYMKVIVLGAALVVPVAVRADDHEDRRRNDEHSRRYEDRGHHDFHVWNEREDRAYRRYLDEHHRKYHDFE